MSLDRALRDELLRLLRSDPELRAEVRALLVGEPDQQLTIAQAAELAGSSPRTIARQIRSGALPATGKHKATRIARSALLAFLDQRRHVDHDDPAAEADREDGLGRWPQ